MKQEAIMAEVIPVEYMGLTVPLSEYVEDPNAENEITKTAKPGYHQKKYWKLNPTVNPNAQPQGWDPALQRDYAQGGTKALVQNFAGIGNTNVDPADPSVAVGPNHVIQMINGGSGAYFKIWNKTGTQLLAQTYLDNYMSFPGGAGDPIVMYDQLADRWFLSEFSASGNKLMIAISQTADPMGAYHKYQYTATSFPDYPKYSVWNDCYLGTTNENSSTVYAFNRTSMLNGTLGNVLKFTMTNFGTIGFQAATPVNLLGTTVPPTGSKPMVMRMRDDAWSGSATDALEIWQINLNFTTPASSSMTQLIVVPVAAFDSGLCGYTSFSCIDQPGTSTNLDPLREVLMNRVHYRNFGTHESIVCCHAVDVNGADRAGIRWYELRRSNGTSGTWSIYQSGTYSPDTQSRWMGAIGISASGNIGMAFNVSGNTVYPSLRYTGRKVCDPLNTMTEPETVIINGTNFNASNRYGDYNDLTIDPSNGENFWFTGMYNPATAWSTRVAAFNIDLCSVSATVAFDANSYTVNESEANVANNCRPYKVVSVPISITTNPTQPAGITVNVTGGTATQGVDFDIQSTNFSLTGSTLSGTVEVRVYNDDYVEGTETIILGYSLNANGGNAATGSINQTVTITINDNDLAPSSSTTTVTILSENFNSGFGQFTTVNPSGNTAWQVGTAAQAATTAYAIPTWNGTTFAWINDDACNCTQNAVDLIFPQISLVGYSAATLTFSSYFEDNTYQNVNENAGLYVSLNNGAYTYVAELVASQIDAAWTNQSFNLSAYLGQSNVRFAIRYSDGGGWLYGCTIDDVLITGTSTVSVQTAVNTSASDQAYFGPNSTVHFYDPTSNNVMVTLVNNSTFDYGCVTLAVDRDGTTPTALPFITSATPDFLHGKTFTITPQNANPTGSYTATLFYKAIEVSTWETLTGNSRNNAKMYKVAGSNRINDVTPANFSGFTIADAPVTVGTFGSDVTFTSTFNSGFSGFGVGLVSPSTAIKHDELPGVSLFPNPSTGLFTVSGLEKGRTVEVTDETGRTVFVGQVNSNLEQIDLSGVAPGLYVLRTSVGQVQGTIRFLIAE